MPTNLHSQRQARAYQPWYGHLPAWLALWALFLAAPAALAAEPARPGRQHQVYFAGTPNELNVYRVYGARGGKTLMLIGGIQGDEPGGFLSADLYADIALAQGNLIVVPRANFLSIMQNNRGADGDMNRQFGDPVTARRHKQIVEVLKALMAESDMLLNLHDGSGYYRPTWEGPLANPMRYGQSLIADSDVYKTPDGRLLDLKGMAEGILPKVNARIEDPKYHLHFNNHRTSEAGSKHKEQRLSATFYALTRCHIPAFGVESSKSLPNVAMKIRHHNLVINAFMEQLGIVPETPPSNLPAPEFKFLVVKVNDFQPVAVAKGSHLTVAPGDRLTVQHIQANYERGLSCDIEGLGSVNDLGQTLTITKPAGILVRKDNQNIGRVEIKVDPAQRHPSTMVRSTLFYFVLDVEGRRQMVADGERIRVVRGDRIVLRDVMSNLRDQSHIKVDFKGYQPPGQANLGEDRGHTINSGRELQKQYSLCQGQEGLECYQVTASQLGRRLGLMQVEVAPAQLDYLVLRRAGHKLVYHNGETVLASPDERLEVMDVKSNITATEAGLALALDGQGRRVPLAGSLIDMSAEPFRGLAQGRPEGVRLVVLRNDQAIGHVQLQIGGR
ncbi:MAG: succinylglutamate desuccinylase/aspartoacylase family protein [Desulfarculus sp.]|nr:succinylglutamate desuccinylase/aspartoacylase family protein [Desulfarculus sp.]